MMQSKRTHDNDRTTVHRPVKRSMIGACFINRLKVQPLHTDGTLLSDALATHGEKKNKTHGKPVVYHEDQTEHIFSTLPASVISHLSPYLQRYPS